MTQGIFTFRKGQFMSFVVRHRPLGLLLMRQLPLDVGFRSPHLLGNGILIIVVGSTFSLTAVKLCFPNQLESFHFHSHSSSLNLEGQRHELVRFVATASTRICGGNGDHFDMEMSCR
jgi:hypothetical protein